VDLREHVGPDFINFPNKLISHQVDVGRRSARFREIVYIKLFY
jgi:hypothetical protein